MLAVTDWAVTGPGVSVMLDRATLSAEHRALMDLAAELLGAIGQDRAEPERIARIRWNMTRELLAHLAKEDKLLYPSLKTGQDPRASAMATRFAAEMGDLADSYRAYIANWSAERMAREWIAFGMETRRIMQALGKRIEREESVLYPMIPTAAPGRYAA
ncbi:hypothetical protein GCM10011380_04330 [Sphingomonas metalli]|uniref:Hemerythrin-like domain-containing protein n=1 Tax=Sphingomonas metalli TaxID=1779358 RepID=A0A916WPN3_9SPHN|nr:hemerythrin domain-containing protein [Sphingomonas metalli]GGB17921.1 hypothetical protein GCM10011380_04330 [Sphingomonas metalli]